MLRFLLRLLGLDHLGDLLRPLHAEEEDEDDVADALAAARDERPVILPLDPDPTPRPVTRKLLESPPTVGPEPSLDTPDLFPPDAPTPVVAMPIIRPGPFREEAVGPGLRSVSAWVESSALRKPKKYIALAKRLGLTELILICNDHSATRKPRKFTIFNRKRIVAFAKEARAAGLEIGLMSWIAPHEAYIRSCAKVMTALAIDCDAHKVELDAEEPWMLAKLMQMTYDQAGALVGECFGKFGVDRPFKLGVNGIGFASKRKLRGLAACCDYVCPQCYTTRTQPLHPGTTTGRFYERWYDAFGPVVVIVGLAAYRQTRIKFKVWKPKGGEIAFGRAIRACVEHPHVDSITLWSLRWLLSNEKLLGPILRDITIIPKDPVLNVA